MHSIDLLLLDKNKRNNYNNNKVLSSKEKTLLFTSRTYAFLACVPPFPRPNHWEFSDTRSSHREKYIFSLPMATGGPQILCRGTPPLPPTQLSHHSYVQGRVLSLCECVKFSRMRAFSPKMYRYIILGFSGDE